LDLTTGDATMRRRSRSRVGIALAAAVVLATAGLAGADHYPPVPGGVQKKDRKVLDALRRLSYADSYEKALDPIEICGCLEETCYDNELMISCGGEMEPFYAGALTAVRRTSRATCLVCGCTFDYATLRATPVCAGF